ncbi:uncharacterized protein B0H18DRAFT_1214500 [Fomitopsis serialis]|uniref:uncharacterized protein n=1 Tax=Fomitopsis serialis TaxID=139415 RepID=UPI002008B93D|nr:uncharacterized protein B0H18DRAFT_1214500 [Neoantrodia serialis]KAH9917589.1 hypothetical protein B0H18DRAFT_1214500 [Neoantrodia serialis]
MTPPGPFSSVCTRRHFRPAAADEHFPVCKQCQLVAYCSRACQEAAWPDHKSKCREECRDREARRALDAQPDVAAQQAAQGVPPVEVRTQLLRDFTELHKYTAYWALCAALDENEEDPTNETIRNLLIVEIAYRKDCDDDPSRAYYVTNARLCYIDKLHIWTPDEDLGFIPGSDITVIEFPTVLWHTDDGMSSSMIANESEAPHLPSMLHNMDGSRWFDYLLRIINSGLVFRTPEHGPRHEMSLGRLEKSGSGWRWRSLKSVAKASRKDRV